MVSFPNAKINIGLNITGKRADGYHDLETVFYPLQIKDAVEIVETSSPEEFTFSASGDAVPGNEADNLCLKAFRLLKKNFPQIPSVKIHLHKNIPSGAGLGGGSADAAAVLHTLNKKFDLNISRDELLGYAAALGSDCAFFILNKTCFAQGRGEILEEINIDLSAYRILIVNPGIHINTAKAFSLLDPGSFSGKDLRENIQKGIGEWHNCISNDFENAVFPQYPEIRALKDFLYESGALYSAMSGSGSSVYGIFPKDTQVNIKFPSHYFWRLV